MTGLINSHIMKAGLVSAALFATTPLYAQMSPAAPAEPAAPAATAPAPAAGASNFSDAEIKQFAAAAVEVTKIQQDSSISAAEKQPKMLAAVQSSGLPPEKFNQIGQAAAADPALQQRIQASAPAAPAAPQSATPAQPAIRPSRRNKDARHEGWRRLPQGGRLFACMKPAMVPGGLQNIWGDVAAPV